MVPQNFFCRFEISIENHEIEPMEKLKFEKSCILGQATNHILMTSKHHIHMCKYKNTIPTVASLMKSISDTEYLERQIALSKHKMLSHEKKWRNYLD